MRRLAILLVVAAAAATAGGLGYITLTAGAGAGAGPGAGRTGAPPLDSTRALPQGGWYVSPHDEPDDLNPFTTRHLTTHRVILGYTHDTLLEIDPNNGALRPALAESHEVLDGGARVVFTLRAGARFADGHPVEAADLLFTHAAATNPQLPLGTVREAIDRISSVRALPDGRVEFTLHDRTLEAFGAATTGFVVVSRRFFLHAVAARARASGEPVPTAPGDPGFARWLRQINDCGPGTGPFALGRDARTGAPAWRPHTDLELVRNRHSWRLRERPRAWNLAGIRLRFLGQAAQYVALRNQEIDWCLHTEPFARLAQDADLAANYRALVYEHIHLGRFAVLWNHRHPGLDDPAVRRALSCLFDRERLVRELFGGHASVANTWFKPGSPHYTPNDRPLSFDIDRARAMLAAAGFDGTPGKRLQLTLSIAQVAQHEQIAQAVVRDFARAGVTLSINPVTGTVLNERIKARDFNAMLAYVSDKPWRTPTTFFHSSQLDGLNVVGLRDDDVDRILDRARAERDTTRRTAIYQEFETRLRELQPMALLVRPKATILLHRRFQDAEPNVLGLFPERWWVDPEDQLHR